MTTKGDDVDTVSSADGTAIAYDRTGHGPPVVLVAGALTTRRRLAPLAASLQDRGTIYAYDRRGRGDSGDTPPYAVDRELEDLAAVIGAAGGRAAVYGHSSGAGLALRAAVAGLPIDRLVLHEPPYGGDAAEEREAAAAFAAQLGAVLADGRDEDALEHFLATAGIPPAALDAMRAVPTLVVSGTASPPFMAAAAERLAGLIPGARRAVLDGHGHEAPPEVVAPAVAPFLAG